MNAEEASGKTTPLQGQSTEWLNEGGWTKSSFARGTSRRTNAYRIAITGSTGLIGQSVIRYLRANGMAGQEVEVTRIIRQGTRSRIGVSGESARGDGEESDEEEAFRLLQSASQLQSISQNSISDAGGDSQGSGTPPPDSLIPSLSRQLTTIGSDRLCLWDGISEIESEKLEDMDCILNLAGEPMLGRSDGTASGDIESDGTSWSGMFSSILGGWTEAKKKAILQSRIDATRLIVNTVKGLERPPPLLINASTCAYYGTDNEGEMCTEDRAGGAGFIPNVAAKWEAEARRAAEETDTRVVLLRMGCVFSARGGLINYLYKLISMRAGGRLGNGEQEVSWVTALDVARCVEFVCASQDISGPVNICSPHPTTNATLMKTFHTVAHPGAWLSFAFPVPAAVLTRLLGGAAEELLLGGQKCVPHVLNRNGFHFVHADLECALRWVVEENRTVSEAKAKLGRAGLEVEDDQCNVMTTIEKKLSRTSRLGTRQTSDLGKIGGRALSTKMTLAAPDRPSEAVQRGDYDFSHRSQSNLSVIASLMSSKMIHSPTAAPSRGLLSHTESKGGAVAHSESSATRPEPVDHPPESRGSRQHLGHAESRGNRQPLGHSESTTGGRQPITHSGSKGSRRINPSGSGVGRPHSPLVLPVMPGAARRASSGSDREGEAATPAATPVEGRGRVSTRDTTETPTLAGCSTTSMLLRAGHQLDSRISAHIPGSSLTLQSSDSRLSATQYLDEAAKALASENREEARRDASSPVATTESPLPSREGL